MNTRRRRVAVIGGGVAGLGAAWALRENAEIVLYDKADRFGGHAWTVSIDRVHLLQSPELSELHRAAAAPRREDSMDGYGFRCVRPERI